MKDYKEQVSGLISEDELQGLAGGAAGGDAAPASNPSIILSIIETIRIATEIVCPSSACTNSGYC